MRKLVAALACRNKGSRLYGKPLQNLDIDKVLEIGAMNERIVGRRLRSEAIKNGRIPKSLTGR